jgi:hypothetical protein
MANPWETLGRNVQSLTQTAYKGLADAENIQYEVEMQKLQQKEIVLNKAIDDRNRSLLLGLQSDAQRKFMGIVLNTDFTNNQSVADAQDKIFGEQGLFSEIRTSWNDKYVDIPNTPNNIKETGLTHIKTSENAFADKFLEKNIEGAKASQTLQLAA